MSDDKQDLRDAFDKVIENHRSVRLLRAMADQANVPIDFILITDILDKAIEQMGDHAVGKILKEIKKEDDDAPSL